MTKSVKINGVTYSDVPSVNIPLSDDSGDAVFYETSADDVVAAEMLSGKKGHNAAGAVTGNMTNVGQQVASISTKAGTVTPTRGYHDGTGSIGIDSTEQAKIIAGNIKSGITLLGVSGDGNVVDTEITSDAAAAANIDSGKKGYANGSLITGTATHASISQDGSTKVLTVA